MKDSKEEMSEIVDVKQPDDLAYCTACLHVLFMSIDDLIDFDHEAFFRAHRQEAKTMKMSPRKKNVQKIGNYKR